MTRKRYIKLLMPIGVPKNAAAEFARHLRHFHRPYAQEVENDKQYGYFITHGLGLRIFGPARGVIKPKIIKAKHPARHTGYNVKFSAIDETHALEVTPHD